jgi:hypothetical protein
MLHRTKGSRHTRGKAARSSLIIGASWWFEPWTCDAASLEYCAGETLKLFWDSCPFTARFMVFANLLKFFVVLHIRISGCTMYRRRLKVSMFACFLCQSGFWSWSQNVCECSDCRKTWGKSTLNSDCAHLVVEDHKGWLGACDSLCETSSTIDYSRTQVLLKY